jgi:RNA polymerase sigma factor (sigma-70 family)
MDNLDDMELVREYAVGKSDQAFATIVARHIHLVYSAALRQLGDAQQAEEVTQAVFLILARKAGSLHRDTTLSGWLYQTAQFTAANARRAAIRQHRREQEAQMQFMQDHQTDDSWRRLAPVLEQAMSRLGQKERDAVILRYFENRTVGEVAAALRVNEAAAQKRVNRGTEKLRKILLKRGIPISAAVLSAAMGTNAVQAAPALLVSTVAAPSAAAGGSTLALTNTTLKLMAWAKAKTAALIAAVTLGATATATIAVEAVATPARSHVQFEGEGFLLGTNLMMDGGPAQTNWTDYFKVTVRDGEWRIVTQSPFQKPDFTETGYDGKELIKVTHFENFVKEQIRKGLIPASPVGTNLTVAQVQLGINSAGAEVQYFPIPYFPDACRYIWFAYASQPYLDKARRGYLSPISLECGASEALVRMGYEQKAQLTRHAAFPRLPERTVFFGDGWILANIWPLDRDRFSERFTNSIFQALAFTNLEGIEIPTHFTISEDALSTAFFTHAATNTNAVVLTIQRDFYLTNLSSKISVSRFKPEFPNGIATVWDYRLSGENPYIHGVNYKISSGWLSVDQVKQLREYKDSIAQARHSESETLRDDGLLDSEGKRLDSQHKASVHPLNFPHSLQRHNYPNPILVAALLAGVILIGAFLLRLAVRLANRQPR